jgi:DHA2 family multidrug resistance protein
MRSRDSSGVPLFLITLTTMLGMILAIIDTSIVNVALNNIAGTLGASLDEIGWVVTAYILAMVIVMPLNGWLTARFGRRNFYAACIVLFTVSSFLCGTATELWQLVLFRVLQGIGGGALQPTAQAIMFESYPPEKRGGAQAVFGLGAVVGPTVGPIMGGIIVDNYSWPLIFFINIPVGIAAFFMTLAFIKDQTYVKRSTSPVDWVGLGLLVAGLGSLQYVLERGQREDWFNSQTIVAGTAIAVGALIAFVIRELRDPQPLVDLRVFKSWSFSAGNIIGIVSGFGVSGLALMLPLYFQNVMGFDALTAGFALVPSALARAISLPIAGRLVNWLDYRIMIAIALLIVAVACWMMGGLNQEAGLADSFWPRALQGFGLGFLFVPLTNATLGNIARTQLSNAAGVYTLLRQLGGSLGIAILQFAETRREDAAYATLAAGITMANRSIAHLVQSAPNPTLMLATIFNLVGLNAETIAYNGVFRMCAVIFTCAVPFCLLLRGRSRAGGEAAVVE